MGAYGHPVNAVYMGAVSMQSTFILLTASAVATATREKIQDHEDHPIERGDPSDGVQIVQVQDDPD